MIYGFSVRYLYISARSFWCLKIPCWMIRVILVIAVVLSIVVCFLTLFFLLFLYHREVASALFFLWKPFYVDEIRKYIYIYIYIYLF